MLRIFEQNSENLAQSAGFGTIYAFSLISPEIKENLEFFPRVK
jgi:hypothetical protein